MKEAKVKYFLCAVFLFSSLATAQAAIKTENVEYKQDETILEGFIAYDDAVEGKRPAVIVVHDWVGFGDYANHRAKMLAELGYVAFAVDIYGKDVRPKNTDEAAMQASKYKGNRALMRQRIQAGLDFIKSQPLVDANRVAVMGYCFGGTVSLELARSRADIVGAVSFHGGLSTPNPEETKNIKAKVLVLHGADDPYVPAPEVQAFQKEMTDANTDWQMIYYSGAVHSFTRRDAGDDNSKGVAYNANADKRSWEAMKQFFREIFGS